MTTPEGAGPARPARLAGLALLALAAIALIVGLISVISSGGGSNNANASPSSQPSAGPTSEAPSSAAPPSSSATPPSSSSTTAPPPSSPPSSAAPPAGTSANNPPAPGRTQDVRVYNNSLIQKLADRAATDFRNNGWNVVAVDNYPGGRIAVTTVYFRPGTAEEPEAHDLAGQFGLRVEPRFDGIQDAAPGIIVIVTKEYNPKSK
jgi:cytoskeletal protein RodZ